MADTVDARIPLGYQFPQLPTAQSQAQLQQLQYRNQLAQLTAQQAQQEAQSRNALMNVFKQPGAMDDRGLPTPATIGRVMQVSPEAGMTLQNNLIRLEEQRQAAHTQQIHQRLLGLQINEKQADELNRIGVTAQTRYDDLVASGTPVTEAARIAGQERGELVTQAQKDGTLLPEQVAGLQGPFDPERNRALIAGTPGYKRILDERNAAIKAVAAEKREERLTSSAEARAEAETKTPFMKEVEALYGKGSPEYQRALTDRVKKETTGAGAGSVMGSREAVYVNRALSSANMAVRDLANIARSPTSASTGLFGGRKQGPNLLDATREVLANKITSDEAQRYNVKIAGLQRNLATLESQGLAPSGSLTHQMDAVVFKEGDSNLTKATKLAESRQIVESAMEVITSNERAPQSAKDLAAKIVQQVQGSIPFTIEDLDKLESSRNPKATLKDFIAKKTGASAAPASRTTAPPAALAYLKAHPEAKDQFQAKYGYLP